MSSLIDGNNYDIFIHYRRVDNKYDDLVSEFADNLKNESNYNITKRAVDSLTD